MTAGVNGKGNGANIATSTPEWVYHDPANTNSAAGGRGTSTQRMPLSPTNGQAVDLWIKVGDHNHPNTNLCFIYYTPTDRIPKGPTASGRARRRCFPRRGSPTTRKIRRAIGSRP